MIVAEPATVLEVTEPSRPGEVRRAASQLAKQLGFDETGQGQVAILATELANNLVRHAQQGEILLQVAVHGPTGTIEIVSLDHGPGFQNVERALEDGYSTGGTSGTGLGAVRRLSTYFDVHSTMGVGSAIISRLTRPIKTKNPLNRFQIGAISACYPGESVCGDLWAASEHEGGLVLMVVDGLGHGPLAQAAAVAACHVFEQHAEEAPADILQLAHNALRSTRGAALAIARIDSAANQVEYAGVGNIAAIIVREGISKNLVSLNGIVGAGTRKIQTFTYPWSEEASLLMFSDGLASHLRLDRHPGLLLRDPTLVAGVLYRDFKRGRDDATIVVARRRKDSPA